MSKNLGKTFPVSITSLINRENSDKKNSVIFFLTMDRGGYPHVAMLSPYQICAVNEGSFIFSVYSSSSSCQNLENEGKATFIIQADEGVYYVKCRSEQITPGPGREIGGHSIFISSDISIAFDHSEKAPIVSETLFLDSGVRESYMNEFKTLAGIAGDYLSRI